MITGFIAGILAAIFCLFFNSFLYKLYKDKAVIYEAPFLEEFIKTYTAVLFRGDILFSHLGFGVIEGIFDFLKDEKGKMNRTAAYFAVLSHMFFGIIVYYAVKSGYPVFAGFLISSFFHLLWNIFIYRMKRDNKNKSPG